MGRIKMKAKLDFKSKRTIIITAIIAVLAIGAGVGGYFYAKGNNQAGATNGVDGSQVTEQASTDTPSNNNPENDGADANNGNGADETTATTNGATGDNTNGNNGNGATDGNAGNNDNVTTGNNGATGNARTNNPPFNLVKSVASSNSVLFSVYFKCLFKVISSKEIFTACPDIKSVI